MPTPALPNWPRGAETNAARSIQRSSVGFSTAPLPIRLGRSGDREAWSEGFAPSVTVIGNPLWAVTAKLTDQPPAIASSARCESAPNRRPLPNGTS